MDTNQQNVSQSFQDYKTRIGHYNTLKEALAVAMLKGNFVWRIYDETREPYDLVEIYQFAQKYDKEYPITGTQFYWVSREGAIGISMGLEYRVKWLFIPMEEGLERDDLVVKMGEKMVEVEEVKEALSQQTEATPIAPPPILPSEPTMPSEPEPVAEAPVQVQPMPPVPQPEPVVEAPVQVQPMPPVPQPEPQVETPVQVQPMPPVPQPEPEVETPVQVQPMPPVPQPEPEVETPVQVQSIPPQPQPEPVAETTVQVQTVPQPAPQPQMSQPVQQPTPQPMQQPVAQGGGKSKLPLIIGGVVAALLIVGGGFFAYNHFAGSKDAPAQQAEVTATTTESENPTNEQTADDAKALTTAAINDLKSTATAQQGVDKLNQAIAKGGKESVEALYTLAQLYGRVYSDKDVLANVEKLLPKDAKKAHELNEKAVELDNTYYPSLYELGCDYMAGDARGAVERDIDKAKEYFTQGAKYAQQANDTQLSERFEIRLSSLE